MVAWNELNICKFKLQKLLVQRQMSVTVCCGKISGDCQWRNGILISFFHSLAFVSSTTWFVAAGKRSTGGGTMAGTDEFRFSVWAFHVPTFSLALEFSEKFNFFLKNRIRVPFKRRTVAIYFDFSTTKSPRWDLMNLNELNQSKHQVDRALLMQPAFSGNSFKGVSENFIFKSFNPRRGKNLRK